MVSPQLTCSTTVMFYRICSLDGGLMTNEYYNTGIYEQIKRSYLDKITPQELFFSHELITIIN